ncbi:MAG: transposase [Ktedonobacteraceae bacterium]|nr:transposase [Ktedonobacteraceae bacterium]
MLEREHHTQPLCWLQEAASQPTFWQQIESQLPVDLEPSARQWKALVRVRAITSASQLLRALLCYALSLGSLKELAIWAKLAGVSQHLLSSQAWHQRVRQASGWLLFLVGAVLAAPAPVRPWPAGRVLLVDGTSVCEREKTGEVWRVHTSYDLLAGRISELVVTDRHVAEGFGHFQLRAGDVLVADAIYGRTNDLFWVDQQQASFLVRWSPYHLPVYTPTVPEAADDQRLLVADWLKRLPVGTHERQAALRRDGQRLLVRLIVVVLPPEKAAALRRQRQRQARQKGRTLSQETLFLAGFVLLMSTLSACDWSAAHLVELYRARWQVEMLFKRIKQLLSMQRLRCETPESAVALIAALLLAWLLIEGEAETLRHELTDGEPLACPLSSWQLQRLAFKGLCASIEGLWSPAALRAAMPAFRRVLLQRRSRPLLEQQRRLQLLQRFEPDLVAFFDCSRT